MVRLFGSFRQPKAGGKGVATRPFSCFLFLISFSLLLPYDTLRTL